MEAGDASTHGVVVAALLQMALENQNSQQVLAATYLYVEVLKLQPRHAEANHRLGLILAKEKSPLDGIPYLEVAIQEDPQLEQHWVSYIETLISAGATETVASAIEWGVKFGLKVETAEQLANNYVAKLEQLSSQAVVTQAENTEEVLPEPPAWPDPPLSLTADLSYIHQPQHRGRRYVIVAPVYRHNSAGIRVLYELQKWLVCAGFDAIVVAGPVDHLVGNLDEDIVIYPEVVTGNMLKAKRVVRYILNEPGKIAGDKSYAKNELKIAYNDDLKQYADNKVLQLMVIEPFFFKDNSKKTINAVYVGKGKDLGVHPKDCIYITRSFPVTRREVASFLRSVQTLYTYDNVSVIGHEAMLCGCEVKWISPEGIFGSFPFPLMTSIDVFKAQLHDFIEISQSM